MEQISCKLFFITLLRQDSKTNKTQINSIICISQLEHIAILFRRNYFNVLNIW